MRPFSYRWLGAACALAACIVSILLAVGGTSWSAHVVDGVIFALLAAALFFFVVP